MRYFISFLFLCFTLSIGAQNTEGPSKKEKQARIKGTKKLKISSDRQNSDGTRVIMTDHACFAHGGGLLNEKYESFCLVAAKKGDLAVYDILFPMTFDYKLHIDAGSKMLVKFDDGEIIELTINKKIDDLDNDFHTSYYGIYYSCTPTYAVTLEQLRKMIDKKVVKLRFAINTGNGYIDMDSANYSKWIFSEILSQCFDMVEERFKVGNGLYDNF